MNVAYWPGSTVSGRVFQDNNDDGIINGADSGLNGLTAYLDENNNGHMDAGEPSTPTNANGNYQFVSLASGVSGTVRLITSPASYVLDNSSTNGFTTSGSGSTVNLAYWPCGTITGRAFMDNGQGIFDGSDSPLNGQTVYLDYNNDGTLDNGEPSTTTDSNGNYSFTGLTPGLSGTVRIVTPPPATCWMLFFRGVTTIPRRLPRSTWLTGHMASSQARFSRTTTTAGFNGSDMGMSGQTVYLDENNGGIFSDGDPNTVTDVNGYYAFVALSSGISGTVRFLNRPPGLCWTTPPSTALPPPAGRNHGESGMLPDGLYWNDRKRLL